TFDDIRPTVMSAAKGQGIRFVLQDRAGTTRTVYLVPRRNPEDLYPTVGINPVEQLVLAKARRGGQPPFRRNPPPPAGGPPPPRRTPRAAGALAGGDGPPCRGGDGIVASSNAPANPGVVKAIGPDPRDPSGSKLDTVEFLRNQFRMRGKQMTVLVDRDGRPLSYVLEPGWTQALAGVRLQMGRIAALRVNGPAASATPVAAPGEPGLQTA